MKEHDETILANINDVVKEDDVLYHLGDFSLGTRDKMNAYREYRGKIKCKNIIYILGNHSLKYSECKDLGIFSEVHQYLERKIQGKFCCMFHYPIDSWNHMSKGSYMCHGHCHSNEQSRDGRIIDFALDAHDFKPWSFDEVIAHMEQVPVKHEGHH